MRSKFISFFLLFLACIAAIAGYTELWFSIFRRSGDKTCLPLALALFLLAGLILFVERRLRTARTYR